MERYFILDKYNTFADWDLIVTAKDVTPPEPKTHYVNLDGAHGTLDLSEALTGEITYNDRTVTASFWTSEGSRQEREIRLKQIVRLLHGKKVKIVEPDDLNHYFYGRIKIDNVKNILPYTEFTLEAVCEPWRYSLEESVRHIDLDSQTAVDVVITNNGVKTLTPVIDVSGTVNIAYNGVSVPLETGSYKITDLKLYQGVNVVSVSGSGSVTLTYREADL
jgi:hypothetical protein